MSVILEAAAEKSASFKITFPFHYQYRFLLPAQTRRKLIALSYKSIYPRIFAGIEFRAENAIKQPVSGQKRGAGTVCFFTGKRCIALVYQGVMRLINNCLFGGGRFVTA